MSQRRIFIVSVGVLAVLLAAVSLAWACVPQGSFAVSPSGGDPGAMVTARGSGFPRDETVEIRWESRTGPLLGTVQGPEFTGMSVQIPVSASPGVHYISASVAGEHGTHSAAATPFEVNGQPTGGDPGGGAPPPAPSPQPAPSPGAQPGVPPKQPSTIPPGTTTPNPAAKRAKAVAKCKRRYSPRSARTTGQKRRLARKRRACIKRAKRSVGSSANSSSSSAVYSILGRVFGS